MSNRAEVSKAIETLLAEMRQTVETEQDILDTVEVSTIVRTCVFAARVPDEPHLSDIPAIARATLLGAWVQYAARRATQQAAPSPLAPDQSDPCPQEQSKPTRGRLTTQDMQAHAA